MGDIFRGYGVEILFDHPDDFRKIRETLTRIGVPTKAPDEGSSLIQSCHILHKQGRYAIFHWKELHAFDGKNMEITDIDRGRRNTIVSLLTDWGLTRPLNPDAILDPREPLSSIKVIQHNQKKDWTLVSKYEIGGSKKKSS